MNIEYTGNRWFALGVGVLFCTASVFTMIAMMTDYDAGDFHKWMGEMIMYVVIWGFAAIIGAIGALLLVGAIFGKKKSKLQGGDWK